MRTLRAQAIALYFVLGITVRASAASGAGCAVGIDHLPVAVSDLDRAAEIYKRLGFSIKPGRFHADGIRNEHVKFEDGGGIELITAQRAVDALSANYVQMLAQGEGPAFLSFHTLDLQVVEKAFRRARLAYREDDRTLTFRDPALQFVFFFEGNNRSPTDRPEHFQHANSAYATGGVWIADGDDSPLVPVLKAAGGEVATERVFAPTERNAKTVRVQNGEVVFLPKSSQIIPGRPIVGVVFLTRDMAALQSCLSAAHIPSAAHAEGAHHRSVIIGPQQTLGLWLEFRELR
jgi:catechol 2,3-dioxygenase-like lactoylglutathione lyase family enzyme